MAQVVKAFSLGKLSALGSGGGVPNGKYQMTLQTVMHKGDKSTMAARPGVRLHLVPLSGGDPIEWFYGLGKEMEKVWCPNPTGTGLVPLAGVENPEPPKAASNWGVFLKEMYNAGLPENFFDNDLSVMNPCNVYIKNIPEPEERKGFAAASQATGEGGAAAARQSNTIAAVSEFLEGGKPWEGPVAVIAAGKAGAAAGKKGAKSTPPPAPQAQAGSDVDPEVVLKEALGEVLSKTPDGCSKVQLNTEVFKMISEGYGEELATEIQTQVMSVPDELKAVLATIGFTVKGFKVVPA